MSYFDMLVPHAKKHLKGFTTDFLNTDKKLFEKYSGNFIWSVRESGTSIIAFTENNGDAKELSENYTEKARAERIDFCEFSLKRGNHFFIPNSKGTGVRKLKYDAAVDYMKKHHNMRTIHHV